MKDELLARLESFEIDKPGAAFPFSARLARENGWSLAYARRVIREYLRFVWLAMRAGHPVTPSEAVDEAWHLHLCYTRSYWEDLCGQILGTPLHHGPTEGGAAESAKFTDWYERTLASYRRHFGEEPPAGIWPPVAERFQTAPVREVDPRSHWILPKRRVMAGGAAAALGAGALVLAGCTPLMAKTDPLGSWFPIVFLVVAAAMLIRHFRATGGGGKNKNDSGGCGGGVGGGSMSSCGSSIGGGHDSGGSDSGCSSSGGGASGCGSSGCGGGGCGGD